MPLEEVLKKNNNAQTIWWARYNQAMLLKKKEAESSCKIFGELAADVNFPLAKLAFLRSVETCPPNESTVLKLWEFAKTDQEADIKPLANDLSLREAVRLKNKKEELHFLSEKTLSVPRLAGKVALLERAILLAKKLKDQPALTQFQKKLYSLAPRFKPQPPKDEWLKVAADFRKARDFGHARSFYRKIANDKNRTIDERIQALKGIRQSYKQENKKEEYIDATKRLANFTFKLIKKKKVSSQALQDYFDSQVLLTRTIWTAGDTPGAVQMLKHLERELKGKIPIAQVYWLQARIAEELGNSADTLKWNEIALASEKEGSSMWEPLTWQKAWILRKLKNYDGAIDLFRKLRVVMKDSPLLTKYTFWLGKTLKESGNESAAYVEFQNLIQNDPIGYYGILSHRELGLPFGALKTIGEKKAAEKPSFMSAPDYAQLRWLTSVSELGVARDLFKSLTSHQKKKTSEADQKILLSWYAELGDYSALFDQMSNYANKPLLVEENPEFVFPKPFYDQVGPASKTWSVNEELIYSIMRQESAFNPLARSPVDAFGLMQLTPYSAANMATENHLHFKDSEDLYEPDINIPLGAALLKHLLKKYHDQMLISVAGYNASEDAVSGWLKTRYRGDPLEFIEDIPYLETMNYVKLVLRNYVYYSRVNSISPTITFPEWCLEGLQTLKN